MLTEARGSQVRLIAGLWVMFFLLGMSPGFYASALTNILNAKGLMGWVTAAHLVGPLAALVSPLMVGALADQRMRAERLLGWMAWLGAGLLFLAFHALDAGWNPMWFVVLLALHSLVSGPMWGLASTVSLAHLAVPEKGFPVVRLGGTIGWMLAGLLTSHWLHADRTVSAGYAAVMPRVLLGGLAFLLPATLPTGKSRSWRSLLGFDAFELLKQRDHLVFFGVTGLLAVPLAAFYVYVPRHLEAMGDQLASSTMTLAQWPEIFAMLTVGVLMSRFRIRTVLLGSLLIHVLRFGFFTLAGVTGEKHWLLPGVILHGVGYTFYFITAQIFLDQRVPAGMRGQAQGLLTLVSGGIGTSLGILFSGWLYRWAVLDGGGNWTLFWAVLGCLVTVSFLLFGWFYQGRRSEAATTASQA